MPVKHHPNISYIRRVILVLLYFSTLESIVINMGLPGTNLADAFIHSMPGIWSCNFVDCEINSCGSSLPVLCRLHDSLEVTSEVCLYTKRARRGKARSSIKMCVQCCHVYSERFWNFSLTDLMLEATSTMKKKNPTSMFKAALVADIECLPIKIILIVKWIIKMVKLVYIIKLSLTQLLPNFSKKKYFVQRSYQCPKSDLY